MNSPERVVGRGEVVVVLRTVLAVHVDEELDDLVCKEWSGHARLERVEEIGKDEQECGPTSSRSGWACCPGGPARRAPHRLR